MMHSVNMQAEEEGRSAVADFLLFHSWQYLPQISFFCAYSKGANCSWSSRTLENGHLSLPGMCISCSEDRQTIHPMVPEQGKMASIWVPVLETAGVCESERGQGSVRMGGRAGRLEVAAESPGSTCLFVGGLWQAEGPPSSLSWHLVLPVHGQTFPSLDSVLHSPGDSDHSGEWTVLSPSPCGPLLGAGGPGVNRVTQAYCKTSFKSKATACFIWQFNICVCLYENVLQRQTWERTNAALECT